MEVSVPNLMLALSAVPVYADCDDSLACCTGSGAQSHLQADSNKAWVGLSSWMIWQIELFVVTEYRNFVYSE